MVNSSIVNVLGCGLILVALSACTSTPKRIEVSASPIERPRLELPKADELVMEEVKWVIITPENYEKVFEEIKVDGRPIMLFGITDTGYENLGKNFSAIRAFVQQQQTIIMAYENYYNQSQEALDKANKTIDNVRIDVENQQSANENEQSIFDRLNPFDE